MSNVFIYTGSAIEEVDILNDHYLQLILIQYSIKSVADQKDRLENDLISGQHIISDNLKTQWINELKTIRTIQAFLSEWLHQLNKSCPNPEAHSDETQKKRTH
ncbi:hypothetical protein [Endozoicomonas atrinae]|uniref:hypothetical protein n=1 Tax=Endozoicomonas atrinae TaxID=1333660 RepID=UPI0008240572|nr:hypothetical protein [Endozoicomonas atrinae]